MSNKLLPFVKSSKTYLLLVAFLTLWAYNGSAQCAQVTSFPFAQSFDTVAIPSCWSTSAAAGYSYLWATTTSDATNGASGPQSGSGFAFLDVYDADIPYNPYTLTSPNFVLPAAPQQLSYYYFLGIDGYNGTDPIGGSDPYPLAVQISTDSGVTWTDIYDHSTSNSSFASSNATSNWHQNAISLAAYANQTVQIRFLSTSNYGGGITNQGIDQFVINTLPTCFPPTGLTVSNITSTSASFSWTAPASGTPVGYGWEVVASGAGSGATPVASNIVVGVTTASSGAVLTPNTTYDLYVKTGCSAVNLADTSTFAGPLIFTTPCTPITALPYLQSFDVVGSLPTCWSASSLSGGTIEWNTTAADGTHGVAGPYAGTGFAALDVYDAYSTYNPYVLVSPPFTLPAATQQLTYYYYLGTGGYHTTPIPLAIQITTDGGTTWTDLYDYTTANTTLATSNATSNWALTTIYLSAYANQTVQFRFASNSNYGNGFTNQAIDEFQISPAPACLPATALVSSAVTSSGATVSWTASTSSPANGYIYEVVASGAGSGGAQVLVGTTAAGVTTATLTGLSANTAYDVYVKSACSSTDSSGWAGPLSLTTLCSNSTLPLVQGFNSTTIPTCWTQQYVVGTSNLNYLATMNNPTALPQEGTDFVRWNAYSISAGQETRLVSPPITTTGSPSVNVSFYFLNDITAYTTGTFVNEGVTLQYSLNGTTWTDVQFYPRVDSSVTTSSGWYQKQIILPAAVGNQPTVYIGFKFHSEYGDNVGFDNLNIFATPPCTGVASSLTSSAITTNGFTASWTAASPAPVNGYIWEAVLAGSGSGGTVVASGTTAAGVTTATISGISASTSYDFYVRGDCGSLSLGPWAGPLSVSTLCGNTSLPLVQGFNSGTIPACWSQQYVVGTDDLLYPTGSFQPATTPQEGSNYVEWNSYNFPTPGDETRLVSPAVITTGVPSVDLSFYWFNDATNYTTGAFLNEGVTVQYSTDGTTWTDVQFFPRVDLSVTTSSGWFQKFVTLPAAAGNLDSVYIGFKFHSEFGNNCSFDNLHIYATPACSSLPTALAASSITGTTATVSWTAATTVPGSGYNYILVATGAGPTGTPVASGNTTADSIALTGLSFSNTYDFYVQSNCGGASGTSIWVGPLTFSTPCGNINLPVVQGFNSTSIPNCWTQQTLSGTTALQFVASSSFPNTTPQEGTDYVYWNSFNTATGGEALLQSPPITTTGTPSVDISFYWFNDNTAYNTAPYLNEGVTVQYSTNGTTWTDVQFYPRVDPAITTTSGWFKKYLTLPAAVGNQATVYIGFKFHSSYGDNCSFDNLNIFASPPCAGYPDSLVVRNVTSANALATWKDATPLPASGYNWLVVASGAGTSGTPIASGNVSIDSISISGLTPNTDYDFYAQSNCGGALGVGVWSGPVTFHTPCVTSTLPIIEGFNNTVIPTCWSEQFVTGTSNLQYVANATFPTINPQEGTDFVMLSDYDVTTRLVSLPLSTTGTPSVDLEFYQFTTNNTFANTGIYLTEGVTVQYSVDGGFTWTDVQFFQRQDNTAPSGGGVWRKRIITLPLAVANQANLLIGFQFFKYFGDNVALDNINIFPSLPCAGGPTGVGVINSTTTSTTLTWTAAPIAPANGYNWVVVAAGDSATGTAIASGSTAAGVTTASVTGLTANTAYDAYVQSNCGGGAGVGYWVGPLSFSTPCNAITTLPWTEGFEGITTPGTDVLPPCWLGTPFGRWTSQNGPLGFPTLSARGGTHYITDRYNSNDTIFTPSFALTGGTQYEFYFYYQTDGFTGWDSIYAMYGTSQIQNGMTTLIGTPVTSPTNTNYIKYSAIFTPAISGTYFFGVKLGSTFSPDEIAFDDFGLQVVVPCPNPPLSGTISGPSAVCSGSAVNLSLTGYSPYTVLQWQTSIDSVNFIDIPSATNDYYTDYITNATYYRVKVNCADSSYSPVFGVQIKSSTLCYCSSNIGGGCGGNDIDTAEILGTNFFVNYTTCNYANGSAYTQFPPIGDSTTTLQRNGTYTLQLHMTGTSISSVWIDYNQNGTFEPTEWAQVTVSSNTGSVSITIPDSAVLGVTGLRIRSRVSTANNGPTDACSQFGSGETFDFLINIVDSNCTHVPSVIESVSGTSCFGNTNGSISLALSGGIAPFTHHWSTGDTSVAISNLAPGTYTDTIQFDFGCKYLSGGHTVVQPAVLSVVTDSINPVKCFGGSTGNVYITVNGGTAPYTHLWSNASTSAPLLGVPVGIYTDSITDSHGCKVATGADTVTQPVSGVSIALDSTHSVKCNGGSNGAAYITASGGTGSYTYLWSNPAHATTDDVTGLSAGSYTVVVTDHNLCTATATDSVSQPGVLTIVTDSVINAKCHTSSNGSVYVSVTGGTIPYTYAWTGGVNTLDLFFKPAGAYTLTVTDINGCIANATDTIQAPAAIAVTSNINNQVQGGALGSISLSTSGGSSPYTYRWNTGDSVSSLSNLAAGVYVVTVTDHNGCTALQRDTVQLITGIVEAQGDIKNFNIYPNPSSAVFNVLLELSHTLPVQIDVYSITGQAIPVTLTENHISNTYQIDMSAQADGVYFVKVTAGDNTLIKRITVVR